MNTTFIEHISHAFKLPLSNPVLVFSLILFIILLTPLLLSRIKIPAIIGLIISGIVIGPYGLNILSKNSAIDLFSTIGLLYIMFIAGLELELDEFKKRKYKSLGFAFYTFAIPISIGFPVCYYLLGYPLNTSLLTASMFATHTLVAYPIVSKFGIAKNEAVAIAVGGTILTDTVVLIILAVIMGSENGGLTSQFWVRLITSLAIFTAIMFLVIPRISKWFFTKLESEKSSHYVFVLSVVFFAAFLAEMAGIEPIIGAFVAGLALNRLIPHSSALMNRIEFVGNAIFIPFFLISVGMYVDVRVLLGGPQALIVAAVLTFVAVFSKGVAAFFTQQTYGYSKDQGLLIFGLSSAHAAATLAIILVGYRAGILDENILNGTIVLILFTCIISSFYTQKAAQRIILHEDEEAESVNVDSKAESILIPLANFKNMESMLDLAVLLKDKKSSEPIHLLSVVPNNQDAELNLKKARKELSESARYASASDTAIEVFATIDHNIPSGIIRASKEKDVSIIMTGWPHKLRFIDKFLGDKTDAIIDDTDKNLFICHITRPLVSHGRVILVCPPYAEYEAEFEIWLSKITRLSKELSLSIDVFCNEGTEADIRNYMHRQKLSNTISFAFMKGLQDIGQLAEEIKATDILAVVCARKGAVSYQTSFEHIQKQLERLFPETTRIMIYPGTTSEVSNINEIEI
ncbi:cation:proton antiporter [Flavihumibacter sp. R14]|nr:cation:proton antiporter [Flavihumibacter soli]